MRARLELIASAKATIEMEFFIFDLDPAGRILLNALIKQAEKGVQVRLLVDFSKPIFRLGPAYAKYLKQRGIELHYYNTAPLYRLVSAQHRTHRKLLVVDDDKVILGGRNIADEYFDADPRYNFVDSDVLVEGAIAKAVRESFDVYFESALTKSGERKSATDEEFQAVARFFEDTAADKKLLANMEQAERADNLKQYPCDDVVFLTDPPSMSEASQVIFRELAKMSETIEREVHIESPYFILGPGGADVFEQLAERGIEINVLTNNLHSGDAVYVMSGFANNVGDMKRAAMNIDFLPGLPIEGQSQGALETRWGNHSKRAVIDRKHVLVGTYNIDPRSANLNSELLLICRDQPELASAVLASRELRMVSSLVFMRKGKVLNKAAIVGDSGPKKILIMNILRPIASLFEFLL
ncbi:MAG: phosphatidylserine/phosphatidylglycerophosphate/cardiolipin synthase family protein [Bdellovibrionales bacterium]|nr:phosphatidylserine/phosphatidylglycerophosphate/cardiolipin synthase family protein [Bdellovibrionales bacterium]